MQGCKAHLCCFPTGRAQPPVGAWSWVGIGHWGPQGEPGGAAHPTASLTLSSLCPDITGPIILQTYRAIADYEKSSGTEMALATGDVVDVVEKGESGQPPACPARTSLPHCLGLWPQAPSKALPSRQPRASSLPGPGALAVPPTLQVTSLSVHPGAAVASAHTYCRLHCASLRVNSRGGRPGPHRVCEVGPTL